MEEVKASLKLMQRGKAPGPDGFPSEFYKKFSDQLAPLLLDMFNDSFELGTLPLTLTQASISLIPKKNKDLEDCSSWRPVSLLNSDVKLLAKTLAGRLDPCLLNVISKDQTGFIRGRQLSSNIRRLLNIILSKPETQDPEMVISMDAEKAFDRVEWNYLFSVLNRFGFGQNFMLWIKLLYNAPIASVRTNSTQSNFFPLTRGCRQGCPLSPFLFAIAIEPLSIALRSSPLFTGVYRNGTEHRVSLYADDLLLYVSNPTVCMDRILDILHTFGTFSGYKLNITKSECFPLNNTARQIPAQTLPFRLAFSRFQYLGINILNSLPLLHKHNIVELVRKVKLDLLRWNNLPLSLLGRINSIKMNVLPKFLFLFQCLPIYLPKAFFNELDKIVSHFIWAGKTPRARCSVLQRSKEEGGLALPDFRAYYWAANIQKAYTWYNFPNTDWCQMEAYSCNPVSLSALICSPLNAYPTKVTSNPIVLSTMKILKQFKRHFKITSLSPLMPFCENYLFPPAALDSTFSLWKDKGLVNFDQLYDKDIFISFDNLRTKFTLPQAHLFRYFQARDFVRCNFSNFPHKPPRTLFDVILSLPTARGFISVVVKLIMSSLSSPLATRNSWERELGCSLSDEWWERALDRVNSTSSCADLTLIQFKVLHRIHYSKAKLKKLFNTSDSCDRCSLVPASHTHMFFSCPKLNSFWSSFYNTLSKALNKPVLRSPLTSIFGVPEEFTRLTNRENNVIAFTSLVARRRILLQWKDKNPPSPNSWLKDLMSFLRLEKIKYSIRGCADKFYKTWNPFLSLIDSIPSLDD